MATLSSPLSIQLCAMVMLVDDPGSMPSVLRGRGSFGPGSCTGVFRCTPHAVNPSVRDTPTWKFGESCSVIRYMVKPSAFVAEISRGSLYGIPFGSASVGSPFTASPHQEMSCPSSFAPPRPSITPSPMMPTFFARMVMNALHGPFDGIVPQVPGADHVVVLRVARSKQRYALIHQQGHAFLQLERPAKKRICALCACGQAHRLSRLALRPQIRRSPPGSRAVSSLVSSASFIASPPSASFASSFTHVAGIFGSVTVRVSCAHAPDAIATTPHITSCANRPHASHAPRSIQRHRPASRYCHAKLQQSPGCCTHGT